MFWTLELASHLEDAPWPATKDELIDYSIRSGAPIEVIENLQELEDEGEIYEGLDDIWPDYPSQEDFFFNEDEYWYVYYIDFKKNRSNKTVFLLRYININPLKKPLKKYFLTIVKTRLIFSSLIMIL